MKLLHTEADLNCLTPLRQRGDLVLVPTMGALHAGHLSLVEHAREIGSVIVSIFVNPTQFGPGEDFEQYPRDLDRDLALLEPLGVTAVFCPQTTLMYGADDGVMVHPGPRADCLCGAARSGHFSGVLTIVAKLFNLIRPQVAVFGRKDAQQCLVIAEMVADLKFPIRLLDVPTRRESDGLAMSSRNAYLKGEERSRALCLTRALDQAKQIIQDGERSTIAVELAMQEAMSAADKVDYTELRQVPHLTKPEQISGRVLLAIAAHIGHTRLIDNLVLAVDNDTVTTAALLDD